MQHAVSYFTSAVTDAGVGGGITPQAGDFITDESGAFLTDESGNFITG